MRNVKILITGGHLTPAKAVLDEFLNRGYKDFVWVGVKKTMRKAENVSAEYKLITENYNIPFKEITTGKFIRFNNVKSFIRFIINILKFPIGVIQALKILHKQKPDVIVSFGGYVALPIVIAGKLLAIPSTMHEQTVVVGLANKIISRLADKVFISWEISRKHIKRRTILTGNPIREEVLTNKTNEFSMQNKLPLIYITGGNQGAHIINKTIFDLMPKILSLANIVHQTGRTSYTGDFERAKGFESHYKDFEQGQYIARANIYGDEIGEVFAKSHLIISRSGANVITDILAHGKMAILIPIPWASNNEQARNAELLVNLGLARIISEKELTPNKLFSAVKDMLARQKRSIDLMGQPLQKTVKSAKNMVKTDASRKLVDEVLKLIN